MSYMLRSRTRSSTSSSSNSSGRSNGRANEEESEPDNFDTQSVASEGSQVSEDSLVSVGSEVSVVSLASVESQFSVDSLASVGSIESMESQASQGSSASQRSTASEASGSSRGSVYSEYSLTSELSYESQPADEAGAEETSSSSSSSISVPRPRAPSTSSSSGSDIRQVDESSESEELNLEGWNSMRIRRRNARNGNLSPASIERINRYCEDCLAWYDNGNGGSLSRAPNVLGHFRRTNESTSVDVFVLSPLELPPLTEQDPLTELVPHFTARAASTSGPPRRRDRGDGPRSSTRTLRRRPRSDEPLPPPPPPKRMCCHPDVYKCPVCLDIATHHEPVTTKCGHVFCRKCIERAIRIMHKCPMCSKALTENQFMRIYI